MAEFDPSRYADYEPNTREIRTVATVFPQKVDEILTKHADYALTTVDEATGTTLTVVDLVHKTEGIVLGLSAGRASEGDVATVRHLQAVSAPAEGKIKGTDMPPAQVYMQNLTAEPTVRRLTLRPGLYLDPSVKGDTTQSVTDRVSSAVAAFEKDMPNIVLERKLGINDKAIGTGEMDHVFSFTDQAQPPFVSFADLVASHELRTSSESSKVGLTKLTQAVAPFTRYTTDMLDKGNPDGRLVGFAQTYPERGIRFSFSVSEREVDVGGPKEKYPFVETQITKFEPVEGRITEVDNLIYHLEPIRVPKEKLHVLYSTRTFQSLGEPPQRTHAPLSVFDEVDVRRYLRPFRVSK